MDYGKTKNSDGWLADIYLFDSIILLIPSIYLHTHSTISAAFTGGNKYNKIDRRHELPSYEGCPENKE